MGLESIPHMELRPSSDEVIAVAATEGMHPTPMKLGDMFNQRFGQDCYPAPNGPISIMTPLWTAVTAPNNLLNASPLAPIHIDLTSDVVPASHCSS
jgi:hypothetical protein